MWIKLSEQTEISEIFIIFISESILYEMALEKRGFILSENVNGEIKLSIHHSTFKDYLESCPRSKNGWTDFIISKRPYKLPSGISHNMQPERKVKEDGGTTS